MDNEYKIYFAPLQGYTDSIYRRLHAEIIGGADCYFTPFLRLQGNGHIRNKDKRDVDPVLNQGTGSFNLVPQVLGGRVEDVKCLIDYLISLGYSRIDINLGCPFPMIAQKGEGAGMLQKSTEGETIPINPKFEALMDLIASYKMLEVSLKMRLGWNEVDESLRLLPIINNTPIHSITMHSRLGIMGYKGKCDLEGFEKFYNGCRHNLIYNGDILSVNDANNIINKFPNLEGIMIGRGLLADPILANKIRSVNVSDMEKNRQLKTFHDGLLNEYAARLQGDHQILMKMKIIWDYFMPETDKKLLKKIKKVTRLSAYQDIIKEIFII